MFVNRFFFRYWRYLLALICGCIVIITSPACATSSRNSGSPLLIITSIASSNISGVGATITWSTNRPADSQVEYGVTTGYGNVVSLKTLDTSHQMNLFGLTPNTLYHYRVKSKDEAGNLSTSGDLTFTTAKSGSPRRLHRRLHRQPGPTPPPTPGEPELPRIFLDTTYRAPTGQTITVNVGGDLQSALNQAQPGDVIMLQAGATFTGNFGLPNKSGTGWIIIRTSAADANLPPGTRVTPASAIMPKMISPNSEPVVYTASGAHHYRFIGVEFGVATGRHIYNMVAFDANQTSLAQTPHDLIIDRCYIHGNDAGDNVRRGVMLNCARAAVIDSYISNCHGEGFDSQAICGWNGPGPFKIVNNYLEGAGENVMFGGAKPSIQNLIASDIEFRMNHVYKPLTWKTESSRLTPEGPGRSRIFSN